MGLFSFITSPISSVMGDLTGANQAADATNQATQAGRETAAASNQTIRDMYSTGRQDQLPFLTPSLSALPMYQSAVLGGPVQYQDPNYQRLTAFDPGYVQGKNTYRGPDGTLTDQPPMLTASYNFQASPSYQWQKEQGLKDLGRSLRALGRSNSTYGMNARGRFLNELNANEYNTGLNRLASLAYGGQGTASNIAASGGNAAGQTAGVNANLSNLVSHNASRLGDLYTNYSPLNMGLNIAKVGAAFIPPAA